MMTPQVRQWLYTLSAVASAIVPLLVVYKVLDPATGTAWVNVVAALGVLGSAGAGTAAVVTAKQRKDGTLDFTGSAAEQAIAAIQATVAQAADTATDLEKVKGAVAEALNQADDVIDGVVSGSLVDQLLDAVKPK